MKVELLDSMGNDLAIVNAARVSFAKQSTWEAVGFDAEAPAFLPRLSAADAGLIGYLMRQRHGTPFEMVQLQFRIQVPIGVAREWQRHRIGSFNEVSTRYVEMEPNFYLPEGEAIRMQVGKPGAYSYAPMPEQFRSGVQAAMDRAYQAAFIAYRNFLDAGVAKELARNVLPLGLLTEFIWSVNLRSLFNFLSLRTAPDALLEIRLAAQQVEERATAIAPVAFEAFNQHGRRAP